MIVRQIPDAPPPEHLLAPLAQGRRPFLLLSAARDPRFGRFSFAGVDPTHVLTARAGRIEIRGPDGTETCEGDAIEAVRELAALHKVPNLDLPTPLPAGAVGWLSYDLARRLETLPSLAEDDFGLPDLSFGFYDAVVTWDHATGETWVTSVAGENPALALEARLREAAPVASSLPRCLSPLRSSFSRPEYLTAVARSKELIAAGDVFQVNLSQRFETRTDDGGPTVFRRLLAANPAPFAAWLADEDGTEVLSVSPERFLRVSGDEVEACPIKGTRPRAGNRDADRALAAELLESEKDLAELTMIVDLLRNDLGRVARFGSVRVTELPALTSHPTVHHLHGTIRARLAKDRTVADLLRFAFPCGSITGAPKVRAMEIIEELEPFRRGVYAGGIGYLSCTGEADLSVAIRTLLKRGERITFSVGGGIVADSDPESEYDESLHKGRGLAAALGFSL